MGRITVLLALLLYAPNPQDEFDPDFRDVLVLKNEKEVTGRVIEFSDHVRVEFENPKTKPQKFPTSQVVGIRRHRHFIRFPELADFPNETIQTGLFDYTAHEEVLLAYPVMQQKKTFHAISCRDGKTLWKVDLKGWVHRPLLHRGILYMMKYETYLDEEQRYKYLGSMLAKEIHKITLVARDIRTGEEKWSHVFDNNDRKNFLWKYEPDQVTLHALGDRIVFQARKRGNPIQGGELDKKTEEVYITLVTIDPTADNEKKRIVHRIDSTEAARAGRSFVVGDVFLFEKYEGMTDYSVNALNLKNGKVKWSTDKLQSRLTHADEERFYMSTETEITAFSMKKGKRNKRWSVDTTGASVAGYDQEHVYVFRKDAAPRGIFGLELKTAKISFRIEYPRKVEYSFVSRVGPLLLYADRDNKIHAYDVNKKKLRWTFAGAGRAPAVFVKKQGTGVLMYKDSRVYLIDIYSGRKLWEVPGEFNLVFPVGRNHVLCRRRAGAKLISTRTPPEHSAFLIDDRTPLRYVLGVKSFSPPAVDGDRIYVVGENGRVMGWDRKKKTMVWDKKFTDDVLSHLPTPAALDGQVGVPHKSRTSVFHTGDGRKVFDTAHYVTDFREPYPFVGKSVIVTTTGGVRCLKWQDGSPVWEHGSLGSVLGLFRAGGKIHVLAGQDIVVIDEKSGKREAKHALPGPVTRIVESGGKYYVCLEGRFLARFTPGFTSWDWNYHIRDKLAKPVMRYMGKLAVVKDIVCYTTYDREIVGADVATGKPKWTYKAPELTSDFVVHEGRLWFVDHAKGLRAIDPATGKPSWKLDLPDPEKFTPILLEGKLVFWSSDGWMIRSK